MLPCEPEQFREFISGLLGRPQTIEKVVEGPFDVARADIENLHHLIDQRISSQNDATLMSFCARIFYDDNSSVTLNSFQDFVSYAEVKPLVSRGVHVSWIFLIQFPAKKVPERQELEITFLTEELSLPYVTAKSLGRLSFREPRGLIRLRIGHTDRSWGSDMEALLTGSLKTLVKSESRIRRFASKQSGWIALFSAIGVILIGLTSIYFVSLELSSKLLRGISVKLPMGANQQDVVLAKLDAISRMLASGSWSKYSFYAVIWVLCSIIMSIVLAAFITEGLDFRRPSFVLLTQKSANVMATKLRKMDRNWLTAVGSIAISIIASLSSRFVFQILVGVMNP